MGALERCSCRLYPVDAAHRCSDCDHEDWMNHARHEHNWRLKVSPDTIACVKEVRHHATRIVTEMVRDRIGDKT